MSVKAFFDTNTLVLLAAAILLGFALTWGALLLIPIAAAAAGFIVLRRTTRISRPVRAVGMALLAAAGLALVTAQILGAIFE